MEKNKIDLTKPLTREFLEEQYIALNKPVSQIMKEFGLSGSKITKTLKRLCIKKPHELIYKSGNANLKTKEALEQMYLKEGMLVTEIAEKLGITTGAATNLLRVRGIQLIPGRRYVNTRRNLALRKANAEAKKLLDEVEAASNRKRNRKSGYKRSEATKIVQKITRARNARLETDRSGNELTMRGILNEMKVEFREQDSVEIYRSGSKLLAACCVDVRILGYKGTKVNKPVVIMVDGGLHGRIQENMDRDCVQNDALLAGEITVGRICEKCLTKDNVEKLLDLAVSVEKPSLIRFHRPEDDLLVHPNKYVGNTTALIATPVPEVHLERATQPMTMVIFNSPKEGVRPRKEYYPKAKE